MPINKVTQIIIHHSGGTDLDPLADSSNYTFGQCNEDHRIKFNFISSLGYYVGYHYFIAKDGSIKQGRADMDEGAHTIGQNSNSLSVCLAGNFDRTMPTPAQISTLKVFLMAKMGQYNIPKERIVPHRKFATKTCYGNRLADSWARNLVGSIAPTPSPVMSNAQIIAKAEALIAEAMALLSQLK